MKHFDRENQRYPRDNNFQSHPYRSYDDFNVGPKKQDRRNTKKQYHEGGYNDDRYHMNQHGPPRGYYVPPYNHGPDPYYYGPGPGYQRDGYRDNRKGMSMYPDRRQTMDHPPQRGFNGNFDQRHENMNQYPNRRHTTNGPPRN